MKEKFIKKYYRMARFVAEDQNPCLSRGIGSVIVDPTTPKYRVVATGYNGPIRDTPHPDSYEFLKEYVYPQLNDKDKENIKKFKELHNTNDTVLNDPDNFACEFQGCKICPRKLIGAISGERLELCGCAHSERNALANAGEDVYGFYMFCWCGVPCLDCATQIIQQGIKKVFCVRDEKRQSEPNKYNFQNSRWFFQKSDVEIIEREVGWIMTD